MHNGGRLGVAAGDRVVTGDVPEAQAHAVAARAGDRREDVGVDARAVDGERRGRVAERPDPSAQPVGDDLLELGERAARGLLDPGDRDGGGRTCPTAMATASASSSRSGGSSPPAPRR